jgi:hypothetical protein
VGTCDSGSCEVLAKWLVSMLTAVEVERRKDSDEVASGTSCGDTSAKRTRLWSEVSEGKDDTSRSEEVVIVLRTASGGLEGGESEVIVRG